MHPKETQQAPGQDISAQLFPNPWKLPPLAMQSSCVPSTQPTPGMQQPPVHPPKSRQPTLLRWLMIAAWLPTSNEVAVRPVKTGPLTSFGIAVTEGLSIGEWVVTAGVNSLRESQEVRILDQGGEG